MANSDPLETNERFATVRCDADWSRARDIRHRVYVVEQSIPEAIEWDEPDAWAEHRLLLVDEVAVACARWRWTAPGIARLERFAVLREQRGKGYGRKVVAATCDEVVRCGARRLELSAQAHLERFYGEFGFVVSGAPFDEAGIPHLPMARDVS